LKLEKKLKNFDFLKSFYEMQKETCFNKKIQTNLK